MRGTSLRLAARSSERDRKRTPFLTSGLNRMSEGGTLAHSHPTKLLGENSPPGPGLTQQATLFPWSPTIPQSLNPHVPSQANNPRRGTREGHGARGLVNGWAVGLRHTCLRRFPGPARLDWSGWSGRVPCGFLSALPMHPWALVGFMKKRRINYESRARKTTKNVTETRELLRRFTPFPPGPPAHP